MNVEVRAGNVPSRAVLERLFRTTYAIRRFETEGIQLYRQGLIRGYFHPYLGQEGIAAGACTALRRGDYIASTHRGHGHCVAWGAEIRKMMAELLQKRTGYCQGYGGSMHIADITTGNLGANGIVGAGTPLGVGAALAAQVRGSDAVTVTFSTDGGSNNGTFMEALNLAAIWNLAFVLLIENNQYAVSTTIEESTRQTELYRRGEALGVESHRVDGNDPLAVYLVMQAAARTCREGRGPVLVDAVTYRHAAHHVNDPVAYMPAQRVAHYKGRDPVEAARRSLAELSDADEAAIQAIQAEVDAEMEDAIAFAKASDEVSVAEFKTFAAAY